MKILIVSDNHGRIEILRQILKKVKPIDRLIHLGDLEMDDNQIRTMAGCPCDIVAGNNDFFSNLPREKEIYLGRYHVLLTHGHQYRVSFSDEYIMKDAKAMGMDIVMYGHTHFPNIHYGDSIIAINPGSVTYPRQMGFRPTYILMELDHAGEAHFTLHYWPEEG